MLVVLTTTSMGLIILSAGVGVGGLPVAVVASERTVVLEKVIISHITFPVRDRIVPDGVHMVSCAVNLHDVPARAVAIAVAGNIFYRSPPF